MEGEIIVKERILSDVNNVFKQTRYFNSQSEQSELDLIENSMETVTEANDVLKNGILIETSKGVEWLSLTDALTSGVGGLNLSVEDFQNVAAQLLNSTQQHLLPNNLAVNDTIFKLESIAELCETTLEANGSTALQLRQVAVVDQGDVDAKIDANVSSESSSLVAVSESTNSDSSIQSTILSQVKRKGGWPKGRKRKQELLENRPPKAPSTGYVLYLNEKRKLFKDMPFPEVTKLLGNEWSRLSLEEKKEYLEMAELDKKRYREELRIYRKSEAYQLYLKRKRIKSLQANGTEESDVDATDELDDEDNEELYCRSCDQWFTTLHNKKEHLYGRQHFQNIYQSDQHSSKVCCSNQSLDQTSLESASTTTKCTQLLLDSLSVTDAVTCVFQLTAAREKEVGFLQKRLTNMFEERTKMLHSIEELKHTADVLKSNLSNSKSDTEKIEQDICRLWQVPSLFIKCCKFLDDHVDAAQ